MSLDRSRVDRPSVLLAVASLLGSATDVDTLLRRILDLIAEAMDADRATLFLIDPDTGELYSKAAHLPELPEIRLKPGQGIAGHVAASGRPLSIAQARHDRRFHDEVDAQTGYTTRSLLAVPVPARPADPARPAAIVGVLEALNKRSKAEFDGADLELLEALASQVAEALAAVQLGAGRDRPGRFIHVVGDSPVMRQVYDTIARAAAADVTVLIRGESGTGKELAARAIHANSARAGKPLVKLDCTTIPEGLMEAELFGHERGAFTGADRMVPGKLEMAAGGTILLDEIGELPMPLQVKLLRFVQDREFERVGGRRTLVADVRVLAATHRDLEAAVRQGAFRGDLYYRLRVVELHMPALRDRGPDDVDRLADHFLRLYGRKHGKPARRFSPEARELLRAYTWPGNIRELEHCVESAVVFAGGPEVLAQHLRLPHAGADRPDAGAGDAIPSGLPLAEVERRYIERTLRECGGNRSRAAQVLGIGRNTLLRKLKG